MCACEGGFTCSRCAGTPDDPAREHEPEPTRVSLWDDYPEGVPAPDGAEPWGAWRA